MCKDKKAKQAVAGMQVKGVLTLQLNTWEALEETTVSLKKIISTHWPGIIEAGMREGQEHTSVN